MNDDTERMKSWEIGPKGGLVTCTACSWSAPMKGEDISSADKEFGAHICADHPPLKDVGKSPASK